MSEEQTMNFQLSSSLYFYHKTLVRRTSWLTAAWKMEYHIQYREDLSRLTQSTELESPTTHRSGCLFFQLVLIGRGSKTFLLFSFT